jgi:hypothetical protein
MAQRQRQGFLASVTWVRVSAYMLVTSAVSYLPTRLAGCSVGPGIGCGARKLARTPWVTKKKKKNQIENNKKTLFQYIYIYIYFNSINCQDEVSSITIV